MTSRPTPISHAVFNTMSHTDAKLERFAWLGDGMAAAVWNRNTDVLSNPNVLRIGQTLNV